MEAQHALAAEIAALTEQALRDAQVQKSEIVSFMPAAISKNRRIPLGGTAAMREFRKRSYFTD